MHVLPTRIFLSTHIPIEVYLQSGSYTERQSLFSSGFIMLKRNSLGLNGQCLRWEHKASGGLKEVEGWSESVRAVLYVNYTVDYSVDPGVECDVIGF